MLAISTMWNALNQQDGAALFDELKNLGFEAIELSRHLTPDQVEQLKPSPPRKSALLHPQFLPYPARHLPSGRGEGQDFTFQSQCR